MQVFPLTLPLVEGRKLLGITVNGYFLNVMISSAGATPSSPLTSAWSASPMLSGWEFAQLLKSKDSPVIHFQVPSSPESVAPIHRPV